MDSFEKNQMSTLTSCTNHLLKEGFTENFSAHKNGIEAPSKGRNYSPSEVKIVSFYRFEGDSDPGDNAILYAIETHDGTKGLLIDWEMQNEVPNMCFTAAEDFLSGAPDALLE